MELNELQKVEELAKQLQDIDLDIIGDCIYGIAGDFDWSYYNGWNEIDLSFGVAIGDYQVLRTLYTSTHDLMRWHDKDANEYEGTYDDYKDFLEKHPEEEDRCDYEWFLKTVSAKDFHQYWLNTNTGTIIERVKMENDRYSIDGEWQAKVIDVKEAQGLTTYHHNLSIHEALCANWNDEYDEEYDEITHHVMLWHDLLTNPYMAVVFRYGGAKLYNLVCGKNGKEYAAAVKIANRHKYHPSDISLWIDYLEMLVYLNKDVHNPFYVCPQDLRLAHDKILKSYNRKQEQQRAMEIRERAMARLMEEKERITNYAERISPYLALNWSTPDYHIFVCPSVQDMIEEGAAMKHCVGSMAYDKKTDSLILFCRDNSGKRISTIEYSISKGEVLQNRGACNSHPLFFDEVNAMLKASAEDIRNAKVKTFVKPVAAKVAA